MCIEEEKITPYPNSEFLRFYQSEDVAELVSYVGLC